MRTHDMTIYPGITEKVEYLVNKGEMDALAILLLAAVLSRIKYLLLSFSNSSFNGSKLGH